MEPLDTLNGWLCTISKQIQKVAPILLFPKAVQSEVQLTMSFRYFYACILSYQDTSFITQNLQCQLNALITSLTEIRGC